MRRLLLVLALFWSIPALAQTTSVSGTITDVGGQSWSSGTIQFSFRPSDSNPTGQYFQGGVPFDKNTTVPQNPLPLDNTGSFSALAVPDNATISPSGSTFSVKVCPAATTPCFTKNLTITGATQNISASIVPPAVHLDLSTPLLGARAYLDTEVFGAAPGTLYFNVIDNRLHVCLQTGFPPCTWFVVGGGGGTVTSFSSGNLSPLFTTSVATPTTTPALSFTLSNAAAGTIFGNPGGAPAAPSFNTPGSYSGIGTVTSFGAGNFGSVFTTTVSNPTTAPLLTFNPVSNAANTVYGNCNGAPNFLAVCSIVGAMLPNPSAISLGGVQSAAPVTHQWIDSISTSGVPHLSQPAAGDISGIGFTQISTASAAGCSPGSSSSYDACLTTLTWSSAFADTGYFPVCTGRQPTAQSLGSGSNLAPMLIISSFTASQIVVITQQERSITSNFATIYCVGVHP